MMKGDAKPPTKPARMMEFDTGRRDCSSAITQRHDDARWLRAHAARRWHLAA